MSGSGPLIKCQGIDCRDAGLCWRFLAPDCHPPYKQAYGNFDDVRGLTCHHQIRYPVPQPKRRRFFRWKT